MMTRSKKSGGNFSKRRRPPLVRAPEGLIDAEVEVPRQVRRVALDLAAGLARAIGEGSEGVVGLIAKHDPVGEEEHACRTVGVEPSEPAGLDELPHDLECHEGLAGARGHGEEDPPAALHEAFDHLADGDLLEVEGPLSAPGFRAVGMEERIGAFVCTVLGRRFSDAEPAHRRCVLPPAVPQFLRGRKPLELSAGVGEEVELDDDMAVRGVGEGKSQVLCVALGLLESGLRGLRLRLGFHDGYGEGIR